jgi:DNA-binding NarL/FixJ family response regulator
MLKLEGKGKRLRAIKTTEREKEVLQLVLKGCTNKDIALNLGISDYTARDHVCALLKKAGVKNRAQLMASYLRAPRKNARL